MNFNSTAIVCRWAKDALKEYDRVSGGGCTLEATLPMLIGSLAHLADQMGSGGEKAIAEAVKLYRMENESGETYAKPEEGGGFAVIYDTEEGEENYYEVFDTPAEAEKLFQDALGGRVNNARLVSILGPIERYRGKATV